MSRIYSFAIVIFLLSFVFAPGIAQTAGDYQTAQSGIWSSTSTWQRWGGSAWLAAPHYPDTADGAIHILAGHTVHVDINVAVDSVVVDGTLVIDATKTLEVDSTSSTATDIAGVVTGAGGVITVDGIYKHNRMRASIPTATWNAGSTCLVTGATANSPNNTNQNFYNLTWNCPGQSSNLNLGWANNIIAGDIRVIATGAGPSQLRLTSSGALPPPDVNTITILGNIYVDSSLAYLTSTGSSGTDTIAVILNGNITSKGTFNLATGSGAQCNWYIKGNINALGGTFSTNSQIGASGERADTLFIAGTSKQTFVNALESLANIRMVVSEGAVLDLDTSRIGSSTNQSFALDSGATIITARANGLHSNLNNGGVTTLSTGANYEYDGTVIQNADSTMPATVHNLTINNPVGVYLEQSTTVTGSLYLTAGVLDTCLFHTVVTVPPANIVTGTGSMGCYVVGVENISYGLGAPRKFQLYSNYPNPFNPATMIQFTVPKDGHAVLRVYNILGQEVVTLFDGQARAGQYITAMFSGSHLASGVYIAQLEFGGRRLTQRMVLAK